MGAFSGNPGNVHSTSQYRWLTDEEVVALFEDRLGKSPVLDEFLTRLVGLRNEVEDVNAELDRYKEVVSTLHAAGFKIAQDTPHGIELLPEEEIEAFLEGVDLSGKPVTVSCKCSVCEAVTPVVINNETNKDT